MRRCSVTSPISPIEVGQSAPLTIIAGPCVLEDAPLAEQIASVLRQACDELGINLVFKASFDKANRTSNESPRGPGMEEGLEQLAHIRSTFGVPVTTDVHVAEQAEPVAAVVDILQIPAFLCRQTDLLVASARAAQAHGRAVNVKKGQFLSPREMIGPVQKIRAAGTRNVMLTERGTFFGYHRLVNDFIGLGDLMEMDEPEAQDAPPVIFDCTHSAQLPGAGSTTGGRRDRIPLLARAAVAAGVDGVFMECHPNPEQAPSDASTMLPLESVPDLLRRLAAISAIVRPVEASRS